MSTEELNSLKLQLFAIEQHLKWCEDNNKPKEQLDIHRKVINDIKELKYETIRNYKSNKKRCLGNL